MSDHEAWSRQLESYERAYEALAGEYAKLLRHVEAVMIERAEVVDERDRLRAVVDAQAASLARLKEFAESEILDRVSAELGADLRAQLDASPTGEDT